MLVAAFITSCNRPPDLSIIPAIAFEDIEFNIVNPGDPLFESNTLTLSINIEDGDGDLGLGPDEVDFPYNTFDLVRDDNGIAIEFGDRPGDPIFTCDNYAIEDREETDLNFDGDFADTVLINTNVNQFNIYVDFFRKVNGTFEVFDFRALPPNAATLCGTSFNGRFPCLSAQDGPCDFIRDNRRPIKGTLNYDIESSLFLPIFRTDTLMLKVRVIDRGLHQSNEIETPEFTLQSITPAGN